MKFFFTLGSRAEWGYVDKLLFELENLGHEVVIASANISHSDEYGSIFSEVDNKFSKTIKIYNAISGDSHATMIKSAAILFNSLTDLIIQESPDLIILAGDRYEQLISAIIASYLYIPSAHIQAGERSGSIDDTARQAIARFASIHLTSNFEATERLLKMGEEDWRIHQVGAPQLDQLVQTDFLPSERKVLDKLSLAMGEYVLICFHSTTEQIQESLKFAEELLNIIYNKKLEVLWILPNNDPGSLKISQLITKNNNKKIKIFSNLTREEYLIALKNCRVIIGNSSSGILEAPTFKIPALNLGTRQRNRTRSKNVLDCVEVQSLNSSLERILSLDFKKNLDNLTNPYGDGHSVQRILDLVLSIDLKSEKLVVKGMSY